MVKNIGFKFLILAFMSLFLTQLAFSANGLNVILANQNPDPVLNGNFVYLNFKVSNFGTEEISNTELRFIDNEYFKVASGNSNVEDLGTLSGRSGVYESSGNVIYAKFKVKVSEDAPLGLNTVSVELDSSTGGAVYDFEVLVKDASPRVEITSLNIDDFGAGDSSVLSMNLMNAEKFDLSDISLSLGLDEVEGDVFSIKSKTNEEFISTLKAGEETKVSFELVASPNAESKPYLIPVKVSFKDSLGGDYEISTLASVNLYSRPVILVNLDKQESFSSGRNKLTFSIANPSISSARGTTFHIEENSNLEIFGGKFEYVGDLNADDYQTIQADVFVKANSSFDVNVKLKYLDAYNKEIVEEYVLPVKVYSQDELAEFGFTQTGSSSSTFVIVIVVLVVLYFGYRHFRKNKKTKKSN